MTAPVVREARADEHAEVGRVTQTGFDAGPYGVATDPDRVALLHDAAGRARDGALLVALGADGRIVGTASVLRPGTTYARNAADDEAELRLLTVLPEGRGRGVGALLVTEAVRHARSWGMRALVLDTGPTNPALRLYVRLGFVRVPERETTHVRGLGTLRFYSFPLVTPHGSDHRADAGDSSQDGR
ncbi:GNAT family N-acetyltransferase [Sanguibacter suaedae]|uniref:GNAT family N-acetyltransferase n=1 Tax=Sanguibacter suaedae TaxID=2795737 RepID=A0A934I929_9MICO|nr:GNAT family N-acetyltransferase [Sanguibacter suaedae]MBI9114440.1 GNAT family N-acetyltransferase [Sanguibacter suaedae]